MIWKYINMEMDKNLSEIRLAWFMAPLVYVILQFVLPKLGVDIYEEFAWNVAAMPVILIPFALRKKNTYFLSYILPLSIRQFFWSKTLFNLANLFLILLIMLVCDIFFIPSFDIYSEIVRMSLLALFFESYEIYNNIKHIRISESTIKFHAKSITILLSLFCLFFAGFYLIGIYTEQFLESRLDVYFIIVYVILSFAGFSVVDYTTFLKRKEYAA